MREAKKYDKLERVRKIIPANCNVHLAENIFQTLFRRKLYKPIYYMKNQAG